MELTFMELFAQFAARYRDLFKINYKLELAADMSGRIVNADNNQAAPFMVWSKLSEARLQLESMLIYPLVFANWDKGIELALARLDGNNDLDQGIDQPPDSETTDLEDFRVKEVTFVLGDDERGYKRFTMTGDELEQVLEQHLITQGRF